MKGWEIRFARLADPMDGRSFIVAADHPFLMGPSKGTYRLDETLTSVMEGKPDGILLGPGSTQRLHHLFLGKDRPALIIRADWFSAPRLFNQYAPLQVIEKFIAISAREAFALGGDAMMVYFLAGLTPAFEEICLTQASELQKECMTLGLPLIVEPLLANPFLPDEEKNELLLKTCEMMEELGAAALKVPFINDEGLVRLTSSLSVPIWVLGGEKVEEEEALELARRYISLGAAGIVFGRNVIQAENPAYMVSRLKEVVHGVNPH